MKPEKKTVEVLEDWQPSRASVEPVFAFGGFDSDGATLRSRSATTGTVSRFTGRAGSGWSGGEHSCTPRLVTVVRVHLKGEHACVFAAIESRRGIEAEHGSGPRRFWPFVVGAPGSRGGRAEEGELFSVDPDRGRCDVSGSAAT
jgi:hypothetical protein